MVQRVLNPSLTAGFWPVGNLILSHARITSETVFGALCIYLLNGMSFASVYGLVSDLQPQAFRLDPALNLHTIPDRFDFIYLLQLWNDDAAWRRRHRGCH